MILARAAQDRQQQEREALGPGEFCHARVDGRTDCEGHGNEAGTSDAIL